MRVGQLLMAARLLLHHTLRSQEAFPLMHLLNMLKVRDLAQFECEVSL